MALTFQQTYRPRSPYRSQGMQSDPTLYVSYIRTSFLLLQIYNSTTSPKLLALLEKTNAVVGQNNVMVKMSFSELPQS